jgi:hypothetical protein
MQCYSLPHGIITCPNKDRARQNHLNGDCLKIAFELDSEQVYMGIRDYE